MNHHIQQTTYSSNHSTVTHTAVKNINGAAPFRNLAAFAILDFDAASESGLDSLELSLLSPLVSGNLISSFFRVCSAERKAIPKWPMPNYITHFKAERSDAFIFP